METYYYDRHLPFRPHPVIGRTAAMTSRFDFQQALGFLLVF